MRRVRRLGNRGVRRFRTGVARHRPGPRSAGEPQEPCVQPHPDDLGALRAEAPAARRSHRAARAAAKNQENEVVGKHRKKAASRTGCVVIVVFTMPLLILLTTVADQAGHLIG